MDLRSQNLALREQQQGRCVGMRLCALDMISGRPDPHPFAGQIERAATMQELTGFAYGPESPQHLL